MTKQFDVTSIGQVPVDIFARVDHDFLENNGFQKNQCNVVKIDQANNFIETLKDTLLLAGGAAANTAACLSSLGAKTAFLGVTAQDELGAFMASTFEKSNVYYPVKALETNKGTDRVFVFVTPDGERTFASYYGAAHDMTPDHLDENIIAASKILYIEGYHLNALQGDAILKTAIEIAKKHGTTIAFNPNDVSIYKKHQSRVDYIMARTDIAIMNKDEAKAVTGKATAKDAIKQLSSKIDTGAVTLSEEGAIAFDKGEQCHLPATSKTVKIINTNGAGDHYAAGFLYGIANNIALEKINRLANLCAHEALQQHSGRPETDLSRFLEAL